MGVLECFTYNELYYQSVNITRDEVVFKSTIPYRLSGKRAYMNKLLVLERKSANSKFYLTYANPFAYIDKIVCSNVNDRSSKLFFAPECKVSRDIVRKSGYSITIQPDSADYIVVPYKKGVDCHRFQIFATKGDDAYLLAQNSDLDPFNYNFQNIENYLIERGFENIRFAYNCVDEKAYFLYNYDIYREILMEDHPNHRYVYEKDIELDYPTIISLDTLKIWKNISDSKLRAKIFCSSDCIKYPLTSMYFASQYWWQDGTLRDESVKRLFEEMGYNSAFSWRTNILTRRDVTPEDWNLLNKFIMDELRVPETGGYVDYKLEDINYLQRGIIRHKLAVAPQYITEPTNTEILTLIRK